MSTALDIRILWWLTILFEIWIAARIFRGNLGPSYRFFGIYLIVSAVLSLFLNYLSFVLKSRYYYGLTFIIWSYASSIFEFLAIRELSSSALDRFPAIRAASAKTLGGFAGVLVVLGAGWYFYLSSLPTGRPTAIVQAAMRYQESAALGFTLFVFLFLAFVAWMPVPLSKNTLNHAFLMGAFFLVITLSRFSIELGAFATQKRLADYIGLGGSVLVFAIWTVRIRARRDSTLNTPKGPLNPDEAAVMLARLEELNVSLARSRR